MEVKKIKILYIITQGELGGAQNYVLGLARYFKEDFDIFVASGDTKPSGSEISLKNEKISYFIIKNLQREISFWLDIKAFLEIRSMIKKINPDIIHLNSSKVSILGSLAAIFLNKKIVYTAHGWVFNEPLPVWQKAFYKYAEKLTAPLKDKIICVSHKDYDSAIKEKICREKKLVVIYNGITKIIFLPPEQARKKISELSKLPFFKINTEDILIGSIGNLYKTKGFEYLLQAFKIACDCDSRLKLAIIGEGAEREELEKMISQLNLKSRAFLAGRIDNAAELLQGFNLYVNSSVKEGLPYSIIEAMAAGLPIVAAKVGGIPELISHKEEGYLVDSADPVKLAEAILSLLEDKKLRSLISGNAQKKSESEFTIEKTARLTKEIYL